MESCYRREARSSNSVADGKDPLSEGRKFKRLYLVLRANITPCLQRHGEHNCPPGSENGFFKLPWGRNELQW